jgi:uncharacterized membrane protein (UPF0127 family)
MKLIRVNDGALVAADLRVANSFWSRAKGLMFRPQLGPGEALWIESCNSIHMMFMRFAIDVIFLRRGRSELHAGVEGEVLKVCSNVKPWLGMSWCMGATSAVEIAAGTASEIDLRAGDLLCLQEGRCPQPN